MTKCSAESAPPGPLRQGLEFTLKPCLPELGLPEFERKTPLQAKIHANLPAPGFAKVEGPEWEASSFFLVGIPLIKNQLWDQPLGGAKGTVLEDWRRPVSPNHWAGHR